MLKEQRDYKTSPELDELEHSWWNKHANLIAEVWEMDHAISWSTRGHYLKQARKFFTEGKDQVTVLELGCGSGWVGQSIAGPGLHIVGQDFSESQIDLAQKNARTLGLEKYCSYYASNSEDWNRKLGDFDGVLIHAFLHHLNGLELEDLLRKLQNGLKPGARIFIYEPAFHAKNVQRTECPKLSLTDRVLLRMVNEICRGVRRTSSTFNLIRKEVAETFQKLMDLASENSWYLSPKEVPLDLEGFTRQLASHFATSEPYCATLNSIGWVQDLNFLKHRILRSLAARILVPVYVLADNRLARNRDLIKHNISYPSYAFFVWTCTK